MRFFVRGGVEIEENLFGCPKIFTYRRPSSDLFLKSETVHSRLGRGLTSVKGDIVGNLLSFIVLLFWFNFIKNKGQCWDWRRQLRQMDIWYFHSIARNKIRCWDWRRHLRQIDGYLTFPQYQRHADAALSHPALKLTLTQPYAVYRSKVLQMTHVPASVARRERTIYRWPRRLRQRDWDIFLGECWCNYTSDTILV